MTWSFVTDGIPILYYDKSKVIRAPKTLTIAKRYATANKTLVSHVKTLNAARKSAISFQ